jgi:hypothetical protein
MRSIKTMLLLALTAIVAVAFAVPAMASASNWTQEGSELTGVAWTQEGATLEGAGGSLSLSGTLSMNNSSVGNVQCPVTAVASLNPHSNSGQLSEFTATPAGCKLTGALKEACTGVESMSIPGSMPSVTATEAGGKTTIASGEFGLMLKLTGGSECITTWLYAGSLVATPNNATAISSVSLSGSFTTYAYYAGALHSFGKASPSGTLNASPAGKYGVSRQRTVKVSGDISWTATNGNFMTCIVNGTIVLEPGSEGKLTSLALSKSGGCMGAFPTCPKPEAVSIGAPWNLSDQGTSINMTGVSITFDALGTACDVTSSGSLVASVNNKAAISSTSLSGTMSGLKWTGTLNWTPAGVYGL